MLSYDDPLLKTAFTFWGSSSSTLVKSEMALPYSPILSYEMPLQLNTDNGCPGNVEAVGMTGKICASTWPGLGSRNIWQALGSIWTHLTGSSDQPYHPGARQHTINFYNTLAQASPALCYYSRTSWCKMGTGRICEGSMGVHLLWRAWVLLASRSRTAS